MPHATTRKCFNPVSRIWKLESDGIHIGRHCHPSFNPVSRIWKLERRDRRLYDRRDPRVSIPFPGFGNWKAELSSRTILLRGGFNPVSRIWKLESHLRPFVILVSRLVSIPFPGFGNWKVAPRRMNGVHVLGFNPVSRIWKLESIAEAAAKAIAESFNPVSRIWKLESERLDPDEKGMN